MLHQESRTVRPVPHNAMQARDRVRSLIESSGMLPPDPVAADDALTDALLVTSELVTNAIRHGGGLLDFHASVAADGLRLVVTDASSAAPAALPRATGPIRAGGFGWPLIRRLAQSVTIRPTPQGGKSIEVLMPLDGAARPADSARLTDLRELADQH
ncbi:ATP-binding protein [Streptomyces sp. cmx-4-9]|uniref:ATP-binding protein n=1 Tax=Streptomyces sp. cmx-4-9 TaxID=2790941 RepID=UPI00397EE978